MDISITDLVNFLFFSVLKAFIVIVLYCCLFYLFSFAKFEMSLQKQMLVNLGYSEVYRDQYNNIFMLNFKVITNFVLANSQLKRADFEFFKNKNGEMNILSLFIINGLEVILLWKIILSLTSNNCFSCERKRVNRKFALFSSCIRYVDKTNHIYSHSSLLVEKKMLSPICTLVVIL